MSGSVPFRKIIYIIYFNKQFVLVIVVLYLFLDRNSERTVAPIMLSCMKSISDKVDFDFLT